MKDKNTHIYELFLAYVSNEITEKDAEELQNWILINSDNKKEFTEFLVFYKKTQSIKFKENFNKEEAWSKIVKDRGVEKRKPNLTIRHRRKNLLKYAALLIGIISGTYYYTTEFLFLEVENSIESEITLHSNEGGVKILLEDNSQNILNKKGEVIGRQKGNEIRYASTINSKKIIYNELSVPHGKIFNVFLSDGSKVVLNAGTTLRYPISFVKGKPRKVFLEGEAYFKVTKNKMDAFIVETNQLSTKVFGTEFNVSSYKDEVITNVVLVEGSVGVYKSGKEFDTKNGDPYLIPGQLASSKKTQKNIVIKEVDTYLYTAWLEGVLYIRNESFLKISKKLERKYNVVVDNQYKALDDEVFTAKFDVENISNTLDAFKKIHPFNYEITNNKITITP